MVAETAQKKSCLVNSSFWSADKGTRPLSEAQVKRGYLWKSNIFLSSQPHKLHSLLHILRREVADQAFFCCWASACICPRQKKTNDLKSRSPQTFVPHRAKPSNLYWWLLENSRVYRVVKRFLSRKSSISYKKVLTSYPYYLIMLVGIPQTAPIVSVWF